MAQAKKRKNVVSIPDLTDVETGYTLLPEGDYHVKVAEAKQEESSSGNDMIVWDFEVVEGKQKGGKLRDYTSLGANALWKLKGYLQAMNFELPDSAFDLDLDDLKGEEVMARVEHEEYDGKNRARIVDLYAVDGEEGEADEEEEEPKAGKKAKEPEEEEEEKPAPKAKAGKAGKKKAKTYSEDDVMELDEDGLGELVSIEELEVDLDEHATIRKKRNAVIEALEAAGKLASAE